MCMALRAKAFSLGMVVSFILLGSSPPLSAGGGLVAQVREEILPNGLKAILLENHRAPVVSFQLWYRVGSRDEKWGKTGLSHLLEHMMFRGTKKFGPGAFTRIIQENGWNANAFTTKDYTAYFENLSSDRIGLALDLEADRMQNLVLKEQDFQTERMVVREERRLHIEDNPRAELREQLGATAFQEHPYHWPVIGWMQDLARLELQDLRPYYKTYYNPGNAYLVAVGDFKAEEILSQITEAFGDIPKGNRPDRVKFTEPSQGGERRVVLQRAAQTPSMVVGFHVPNVHNPDGYALEVIASVLSAGKSARLYKSLVSEKQLAREVDADYPLLSLDPALFLISVEPMPDKDLDDLEKALDLELKRLREEEIDGRELQKAKNQLEASFTFGQDSVFFQAKLLALYEMTGDWRTIEAYLPSIRSVTPQDVKRVADLYLIPERRTVGLLNP
jgi:zinc protease